MQTLQAHYYFKTIVVVILKSSYQSKGLIWIIPSYDVEPRLLDSDATSKLILKVFVDLRLVDGNDWNENVEMNVRHYKEGPIKKKNIWNKMGTTPIIDKLRENLLRWYGHALI